MERHESGAPEAGGATTPHSSFGGNGWRGVVLRMIARTGRRITGFAYARLRELDLRSAHPSDAGRPSRAGH